MACRLFAPGSEWLYVKLYQGPASLDDLLREWLPVVVAGALAAGADSWSYIRYGDPGFHLRLRFHGPPARLRAVVMPLLESAWEPLLAEGRIWKIQLDTYEREVERYGGLDGVAVAERIFHADSDAALALLALLPPGDEGEEARWRLAALSVDRLLSDFGLDLEAKRKNAAKLRDGYGSHPVDRRLRRQLAGKHRAVGRELDGLLDATPADAALSPALSVLAARSARLAPAVGRLAALERAGRLTVPASRVARSHVHMHLNRLLPSAPREQELVLYDLLERAYASRLARRAGAAIPLAVASDAGA
jgi:thiopeptide-type bacteriocin biosynthesis protein